MASRMPRKVTILQVVARLPISIDIETDGRIIAEIPRLPGVMVYGNTKAEAVRKVRELAAQVLQDMENHDELPSTLVRRGAIIAQSVFKQLNEVAQNGKRRILHK